MKTKSKRTATRESGITARFVIVILLTLTLVCVLRWSMNVTKANARQISHNLSQIQQQMDNNTAQDVERDRDKPGATIRIGPTIDPIRRETP